MGRKEMVECPCGSGLKPEDCCFRNNEEGRSEDILGELKSILEGQSFSSMDEIHAIAEQAVDARSRAGLDDFCGLSPDQMHQFLYFPFESENLVSFASEFHQAPKPPILTLFSFIAKALEEKGMKPTATGNLPLKFCQETAAAYQREPSFQERLGFGRIRSETDFFELHTVRIVAEMAGFIRKYKGKFILTKKCRQALAKPGTSALFMALFQAYTTKFNWGYLDGYPDLYIIQRSFLYSLFLLQRFGADFRPVSFYEDAFLKAYPMVLNEVPDSEYRSKEETLRSCYSLRVWERFAHFWGLVEIKKEKKGYSSRICEVKKSSILDELLVFHL